MDGLDVALLTALREHPRAGDLELSRLLVVARGTVTARLQRLESSGVVTGHGPDVDVAAAGFGVQAFVTLEIAQGRLADVTQHLAGIPEVLEAHAVTGPGDLHCRVVARTNEHLQEVIARVLDVSGIMRTTTQIALAEQLGHRLVPLVAELAK